jgi:anaerobic magnesium-protoporphyrin IX monomethyl ester cyclase
MNSYSKKVLFFNAKREKCNSDSPHLGLAMLAAVLKEKGHEVMVVDYQFQPEAPLPPFFVEEFQPDVMGVTLYTATMKEANAIIDQISQYKIPIMLGGPHATIYYERILNRADYILRGESENIIVDLVENAQIQTKAQIISSTPPNPVDLPNPNFKAFYGHENISIYPLLTSRGCPFKCSFCLIRFVSTRKWRPRKPEVCINEIIQAKKDLPHLKSVTVYDDNPMFRKEHIKSFLSLYLQADINLPLTIINTRADGLDDEIISLLKKLNCPSIAIGVESGHPDVFKNINKGETLEDVKNAVKLIKKYQIPLSVCFVIGLEEDSLEKTKMSVEFAKKLKPDHIYWNMITPFKGTRIREWYEDEGSVFSLENHSSWVDGDFMCEEPCAETPEFTREEREKAYLYSILKTNDTRLKLTDIPRLIPYVRKHRLYLEFLGWIPSIILKDLNQVVTIYREEGIRQLFTRLKNYFYN